jgi:hypothetical protein
MRRSWKNLGILAALFLPLHSCTLLSNRDYVRQFSQYRGVEHIAVFVQRWPVYRQQENQRDLGEDFIKTGTLFFGPFKPNTRPNPRAVDVSDITDAAMGELLQEVLKQKGYLPALVDSCTGPPGVAVKELMARYQAVNPGVEGFLFVYYSPCLFLSKEPSQTSRSGGRSGSLLEIIQQLQPGGDSVVWAGPLAAGAPKNSISHAFIYVSMTMFKAIDWRPVWEAADSQVGGSMRVAVSQCPPGPTKENYWADAEIIQRLMMDNLRCRLRHLVPQAF